MSHPRKSALLILTIVLAAACYRTAERRMDTAALEGQGGVVGFVMRDGSTIPVDRRDRISIVGDTLVVIESQQRGSRRMPRSLRVDEIVYFQTRQLHAGRTVAAVILVPVGVLAALVIALAASSCPFIYAWDGTTFIPAAEPLAGAVTEGLARTDLALLDGLVTDDGVYRIIVANEMDETQYIDALHLLAVDHPEGTRVVADRHGMPHIAGGALPPVRAQDQTGADLLPMLYANDGVWWPHDPAGPAFDGIRTRDTLTLTFPRPVGADSATLLIHARNHVWGAFMLKRMLTLWGSDVDHWYRLLDTSPVTRAANEEWVLREETWLLRLWLHEDDGWKPHEIIAGGGPYISQHQAVPLDLSRVSGDFVELRVHPPPSFWRLDHVALAPAARPALRVRELHAEGIASFNGDDAIDLLRTQDGRYLVMSEVGDRLELRFPAPPVEAGMSRSVMVRTTGFYRVHTNGTGPRNAARLDSIWLMPGHTVRFAEQEFDAWRRENPGVAIHPGTR